MKTNKLISKMISIFKSLVKSFIYSDDVTKICIISILIPVILLLWLITPMGTKAINESVESDLQLLEQEWLRQEERKRERMEYLKDI